MTNTLIPAAAVEAETLAAESRFGDVVRLLRPYWVGLLLVTLATVGVSLLGGVSQVALTPLLELILDTVEPGTSALEAPPPDFSFDLNSLGLSILGYVQQITGFTELWPLLVVSTLAYLVLSVSVEFAAFSTRWGAMMLRLRIGRDLQYRLFGHVLRLPLSFLEKQQVGWLQARIATDVDSAMELLNQIIIDGLSSILLNVFYIYVLVRTDLRLTLVAALAGGAQLGLSRAFRDFAATRTRDHYEVRAQTGAYRQERLTALREIKQLAGEAHEQEHLLTWVAREIRAMMRFFVYRHVEKPIRFTLNRIVIVVVMLFGAWRLINGDMTTAAFLLFMLFAQNLVAPLTKLSSVLLQVTEIRALLTGVSYLLNQPQEHSGDRRLPAGGFSDALEVSNVSFAYGDIPVLRDVSLTVNKGEMVALVGRSGAGKSTLVDLILGFYQPDKGRIDLDGMPVANLDLRDYRRLFGIVSQDAMLFNDTVFNNITYARPDLTQADIKRAAGIANAAEFIQGLPDGYDTLLGERGVRLSGGQRQRIAIARAVAHRPPILVLDEATSALDSESERLVQDAIAQAVKGSTAIVIAHRLSTILMADKIVVLREGRVVEMGRHDELLARGGEYSYLYNLQFNGDASSPEGIEVSEVYFRRKYQDKMTMEITVSTIIDEDRKLRLDLPASTPTGPVQVTISALETAETEEPSPREVIRQKLRQVNFLVEDIEIPDDVPTLSQDEIFKIGTLPPDARPSHELIDEDRGTY